MAVVTWCLTTDVREPPDDYNEEHGIQSRGGGSSQSARGHEEVLYSVLPSQK